MGDQPRQVIKHVNGTLICPACELKLVQAHPDLARWFREVVKPKVPSAHISWSFRDELNQNQCFTAGQSKLKWPNSQHNKCDVNGIPCARAIDLFELDYNGFARWAWAYFRDIAALQSDVSIVWGGDFKSIGDADHYQLG